MMSQKEIEAPLVVTSKYVNHVFNVNVDLRMNVHQCKSRQTIISHASSQIIFQKLHDTDPEKKVDFCIYVLEQKLAAPDWSNNIIFSDEATSHLNGKVNLHNCFYLCK